MKAGIIAAGTGERLKKGGIFTPKPLVPICGVPIIKRTIMAAINAGASYIICIVNAIEKEIPRYIESHTWPVPLKLIVKTTPSSMESLFNLAPFLGEPFLLLTVDAVYPFDILKGFVNKARLIDGDGSLAVTKFVDDEKPLWVKMNSKKRIIKIGNDSYPTSYITAGFYYFVPSIFDLINEAREKKLKALREFLALLIQKGYNIYGIPVSKVIDVDYPEDIKKAEAFIKGIPNEYSGHI